MNKEQRKQNGYNETRKKKIIESLQAICATDICAWADSIFFNSFETPAEHVSKEAKAFHADIPPF